MERIVYLVLFVLLPLGFLVYMLLDWRKHRAKMQRMDKYGRWVRDVVPTLTGHEREQARGHILGILIGGAYSSYHGPWEALTTAKPFTPSKSGSSHGKP